MTRESALPAMLERIGSPRDTAAPRLLVAVDHMSRPGVCIPESRPAMAHRALELLLAGKSRLDERALQGIDHVLRIERADAA